MDNNKIDGDSGRDVRRYREEDWRSLIWACRQGRNRYRYGGVIEAEGEPTPAGEGARWFATPVGWVLLAPSNAGPGGRWGWLQDLEIAPLHLDVFVLSWRPPMTKSTARRRARKSGPPVPQGGRLVLAVSGRWIAQQLEAIRRLAHRQARSGSPTARTPAAFVTSVNKITADVSTAGRYAWVWTDMQRGYDVEVRQLVLRYLVSAHGLKREEARAWCARYLRTWRKTKRGERTEAHVSEQ